MKEQWKDILGYEGVYQVSSLGKIKSLNYNGCKYGKIMRTGNRNGYTCIGLSKNCAVRRFYVHRLVGLAFIPNTENKPQVNHINGTRDDNRVENLEWCTAKENTQHSYDTGLANITKNHNCYTNNPRYFLGKFGRDHLVSKEVNQYSMEGNLIKSWGSIIDVKRELSIHAGSISECCRGKRKTAGGYAWKFNT